ncbi:LytR C-terminal domain-containing protein [Nocardioides limicola]|uniref:LytR C-terminal domain-containing protein n=1 Tax=Nocardioides limicola TaxID=2803368 RepID=UPI00193B205B|nr:LytR C-terminal domain-containing protein [Nocardioides sp. DJM-14]
MHFPRRRRDQQGVALNSPVVMLSIIAVAMAALAFGVTWDTGEPEQIVQAAAPESTEDAAAEAEAEAEARRERRQERRRQQREAAQAVQRGEVLVEVYNNSGIAGLAGRTSDTLTGIGWQVVGSDNWYGTIPAATVYHPQGMAKEAEALANDLGISRVMPAVDPMRMDRLTVILTADFA